MFTGRYQWSLGMLIGVPILILVVGAFLIISFAAYKYARKDGDQDLRIAGRATLVAALVTLMIGALVWFPFTPVRKYHAYGEVAGVVEQVNTRLLNDGNGNMAQRVVVRLAGDPGGALYGCDDTRCTALRKGDSVKLLCKAEYQFRGTPGWACRWES